MRFFKRKSNEGGGNIRVKRQGNIFAFFLLKATNLFYILLDNIWIFGLKQNLSPFEQSLF